MCCNALAVYVCVCVYVTANYFWNPLQYICMQEQERFNKYSLCLRWRNISVQRYYKAHFALWSNCNDVKK